MKNLCKLFFTAVIFLAAAALSFAAEKKSCTAVWLEPGEDAPFTDIGSYDSDEAKAMPLKFSVGLNQYFWIITIDAADPLAGKIGAPRNIVELFFRFGNGGYHQFYGCLRDKNLRFYPHAKFSRSYPDLKNANVSYETIPGKGYRAKLLLPWEDFLWLLPGEQKVNVDLGLFRNRGKISQKWSGGLHKAESWGQVTFPALTQEQQSAIYRQLIIKLADNASRAVFPVDQPERFHSNSLQNWKSRIIAEFRTLSKKIADAEEKENVSPALYRETFLKMREMLRLREYVSAAPIRTAEMNTKEWAFFTSLRAGEKADFTNLKPIGNTGWGSPFRFTKELKKEQNTGNAVEWRMAQFTVPADGHYYITNLASRETNADVVFEVFLSGRHVFTGNFSELPLNVKIGNAKAGEKILVAVKHPGRNSSFILDFAIETMHNGIIPGKAVHVRYPGAAQAMAKCEPDGTVSAGYLHRIVGHTGEIRDMIKNGKMPRLFFVGDSITDGIHGSPWEKMAKFDAVNLGISGDWTQNVLWRMENGMFADCQPEALVLMIGTNNGAYSVADVAAGIKAILDCVQKHSPQTKILLLGIFPRGGKWVKGCRLDRINDIIRTYADGKRIHYMDIGHIFLDKDQVVDKKLVPDTLHPNWRGNDIWMDTIMPKLEELLKK